MYSTTSLFRNSFNNIIIFQNTVSNAFSNYIFVSFINYIHFYSVKKLKSNTGWGKGGGGVLYGVCSCNPHPYILLLVYESGLLISITIHNFLFLKKS